MKEEASERRRRKEARPPELIRAALDVFAKKGFSATRLDDVAANADVSKGTIYLYFDSKEALFRAVIELGMTLRSTRAYATENMLLTQTLVRASDQGGNRPQEASITSRRQ